jgi:hypothetical protein
MQKREFYGALLHKNTTESSLFPEDKEMSENIEGSQTNGKEPSPKHSKHDEIG